MLHDTIRGRDIIEENRIRKGTNLKLISKREEIERG
jgi:hypothetical protein